MTPRSIQVGTRPPAEATVQQTETPPHLGKAALLAHGRMVTEGTAAVRARRVRLVRVQGELRDWRRHDRARRART